MDFIRRHWLLFGILLFPLAPAGIPIFMLYLILQAILRRPAPQAPVVVYPAPPAGSVGGIFRTGPQEDPQALMNRALERSQLVEAARSRLSYSEDS